MVDTCETFRRPSKARVCRFFNTENGCRAGDKCPYRHITPEQKRTEEPTSHQHKHGTNEKSTSSQDVPKRRYQAPVVDRTRIVQKPQPKQEDARSFQLGQIKRRFAVEQIRTEDGDRFSFDIAPSDPDFPYEIDALKCQLDVPSTFPEARAPSLKILNKEIPRGFQINIERGFISLARANPTATLLGLMNRLDRQLESILAGEVAETIKIVVSKPTTTVVEPRKADKHIIEPLASTTPARPAYTLDQKTDALRRRGLETRQLEARFGRLPAFFKSSDGVRYTLPLDSPKKTTWPAPLQSLRICSIIVPEMYPLDPPMLDLDSESNEARNVTYAFTHKAVSDQAISLTQLINFLLINMKDMSLQSVPQTQPANHVQEDWELVEAESQNDSTQNPRPTIADPDKPHLRYISRPPEWDMVAGEDSSSSEDDDLDDHLTDGSTETEPVAEQVYASTPIERGVLLSFPHLDLHGIELLELRSLSLTVRCTRCKDTTDIERLQSIVQDSTTDSHPATPRTESCKKCAQPMTIGFRADLMHASSVRAGYLDLDGCTPADILPSAFTPTCSECSTPAPGPGVMAVRGETAMAICRTCHRKMTLRIQEERFLQVSATAIRTSRMPARKKDNDKLKLGIVAGTELPRRGRCSHYAKSYRWFRFSCCSKVFPCDRCHDEEMEHPNEHANRMLCGFCSREQNYRPEDCGICHAVLVGKRGHGFWEGGKGTRDKTRMSRKDPRKYKRVGGGQPRKA